MWHRLKLCIIITWLGVLLFVGFDEPRHFCNHNNTINYVRELNIYLPYKKGTQVLTLFAWFETHLRILANGEISFSSSLTSPSPGTLPENTYKTEVSMLAGSQSNTKYKQSVIFIIESNKPFRITFGI